MKKLFFFGLIFYLFSGSLWAQKNSISVLFGPSVAQFLTDDIVKSNTKPSVGYTLGLDFGHNIKAHWQLKLGIRYASWQIPNLTGPVQWPSENDGNGGYLYDPSLQHYLSGGYKSQDAIQILPGIRWLSSQDEIHWMATAEVGVSAFLKNKDGISTKMYPTAGLALGAEWSVNSRLHIFVEPGCRMIFRDFDKQNTPESHLLNLHAALGLRRSF